MANENSSKTNDDLSSALFEEDKIERAAKVAGYISAEKLTKIAREIHDEMGNTAEEEEDTLPSAVSTGTNEEDFDDILNFGDTDIEDNEISIDEEITDADDVLSTPLTDGDTEVLATTAKVKNELSTAVENVEDEIESSASGGKLFKLATGTIIAGAKAGKIATKTGGVMVKLGKHLNVFDENGNVKDVTSLTSNEIKTSAKFVKRNFVAKPAKYVTKKASRKIMRKTIIKINKRIAKITAKIEAKVAKISIKIIRKILQVLIKLIAKLVQAIAELLALCLPVAVVILIIVIIIFAIFFFFGSNLNEDQMDWYIDYINDVQTEFQEETLGYYEDGYIVDGTYNGVAYINWQAALSCMQGLQPELDASGSEKDLLKKFKNDGIMYSITTATTTEYVLEEEETEKCSDCNGTGKDSSNAVCSECNGEGEIVVKEAVTTTTKYVVTVGSLDDYKNWIDTHTEDIETFYDKEDISYEENSTTLLTDELIESIDTLYNSEVFDELIVEAGGSLNSSDIADGTIYNTGESSGMLAYPTSYRTISAGYPTYSDGSEHTGVDFPCPTGTPVCACADGEVVVVKELTDSYGKYIVIKHNIDNQTIYTLYAHNSTLKVKAGDTVSKGQVIALSGSTGNSTGPHCHLSVLTSWSPQKYVNPTDYL